VTTKPIANSAINALCKRELLYPTAYWKSMFPLVPALSYTVEMPCGLPRFSGEAARHLYGI